MKKTENEMMKSMTKKIKKIEGGRDREREVGRGKKTKKRGKRKKKNAHKRIRYCSFFNLLSCHVGLLG